MFTTVYRLTEIVRTFGVSKRSVLRAVQRYRQGGAAAFFRARSTRRGGTVFTAPVLAAAQELLDEGMEKTEVAACLEVPSDTLRKALADGRLVARPRAAALDKSARSVEDASAATGMGTACTRVMERVLASLGKLDGAPVRFEPCRDVSYGGVLCALPALLANGLLAKAETLLGKLRGYYTLTQVLILLGFLALARIRTIEQARQKAPGEFGRLLGLDRIPEVRCLRRKLDELCAGNGAEQWAAELNRDWMQAEPEAVGTLYVDGHVRVYHGSLTKLPRKYVTRERLCLRGTTDYWVNDARGRPFFVVERVVDAGLLEVLRTDIVPRLLRDVPAQPSEAGTARAPAPLSFHAGFRPGGLQSGVLRPDVAEAPDRLHHVPQTSRRTVAPGMVHPANLLHAQRGNPHHVPGGAGQSSGYTAPCAVAARGPQAHRQRTSGQPDRHGFRGGAYGLGRWAFLAMVPGKLLPLHDGTLCVG